MADKTASELKKSNRLVAPPKERVEFKKLLALNPNYFGNLIESPFKPVKKMVGNITYEEVSCLGFNPQLNLLEATVQIKLAGGYNGLLCSPGSTEYVRFYIDYGTGWVDAGLAAFNAHDIPNILDCAKQKDKPLSYVVTAQLDPQQKNCKTPVLPRVRAILSWQVMPPAGQPNWPPVWGNVLNQHIQIKPRFTIFGDIYELLPEVVLKKLPPLIEEVKPFPIPLPDPPPFELAQLADIYAGKAALRSAASVKSLAVEPHRFGFAQIQTVLAYGNQDTLLSAMAEWSSLNLDWVQAVAALDKTKANVSYEEIECLGLEYNLERLVATFRVKKPVGYSGGLCTAGSKEHVAFWADWNDTCDWTYLGTVTVDVHDIATIPADGLAYSAILPVDLNAVRRPCGGPKGGPKIGRVRAVLSWNSPPSTVDPDALNPWGNRLDKHVQIRPGEFVPGTQPIISIIGGIGIADIHVFGNGMTKSTATFAFGGSAADPWLLGRECPFGALIIVQGPPVLGHKYRLWARKFGDSSSEQIVKNDFHVVNSGGVGSDITPDPTTGYATYMNTLSNMNQVLAHWVPSGNELWEIRLELATLGEVVLGTTPWYSIQLDNKAPLRRPALAPFEPPEVTCEIHIDSGGDCKDFTKGTTILGHFTARDEHFGGFSLTTLPSSMSPAAPTTLTPSTSQTATFASGGDEWELDTTKMTPCGYVVLLQISDRSILYSIPGHHNYNYFDVGFCLRQ
jgi:hypothetical protein